MAVRSTTRQLRIQLFGQPRFALGDEPFRFVGRPKTMPLLAHLLLNRTRAVSRASLAFLLWEDETEANARANLRRHLLHVQQALPESPTPWLLVETDTVQWNPDAGVWLDVDEFERLVGRVDGRAEAVALYVGDLLENLDDEWLFLPRERLRTQYLRALDELVLETRSARRFPLALEYAQRILAAEPLREDAVRQLMAIRYESGDRAGALQTYERFARLLRTEIDVDPMPETGALRERILRNAALASVASVDQPEPTRRSRVQLGFAGRAPEMEQLRALWSRAARGHGGVALVAGEAGIGKTRLVNELVARAEAEGGRVLWGTTAYPESTPYQAFVEALRGALGIITALDVDAKALAALRPLLPDVGERRADLPALTALDPERERRRLFEALMACLAAVARPRPLIVVIEDLHWAGGATIAALDFVGRRLEQHAILLVGTYRDDETPKSLRSTRRSLQQDGVAQHIPVGRLSLDAVTEIVAGVVDSGDLGDESAEKLWAASEGSPLFLSELIRELIETGARSALPPTLQNVIVSRVKRLSETARTLIGIVAVVGPAFDIDVAREITGWDERQLLEAIDELLARQLVREAGRRFGFEYAFTHHLVRTAVYETLAAESRRVWHRRIAHALEELHTGHDAIAGDIARHFELGGDVLPALPYFVRAARHAEALSAADEALALLAHAQAFPMPRELRAEAILLAETIHRRIGNRAAQQADIEALEELAGDDEQLRAEALYRRILWARSLGLRDDERAYIEALERSAPEAGGDGWRGRVLACKSEHFALINDFTEAEAAARAALGVHQALGDVEAQVADLCLLVAVATQRGNHDVAGEHLAEAQRLAETQRNPRLVADTLFAASGSALTLHDLTAAIDLARTAGERYAALGDRESQADALARIATALARLGRHDEARAHNVDAAAIFEAIGKRQGLAVAVLNLGLISCRMGVLGRAIGEFERAAQLFRSIHDTRGQTVCAINLACLRLRRGETLEAKADAQLALEFARRMKHTVYEAEALANLGAAERDLGELDAAIEHMQLGLSRQLETGRVSDRANDLADLALAYHLHGDSAAACSAVDEVLASAQSASDLSLWPQNLYWIAAQVYRGAGRDEAWPELLATAYRIMLERGSVLTDADERNEFFALPLNREIEDAHVGRRWPQTPS